MMRKLLSERLGALELAQLDTGEAAEIVAEEASRVVGAHRALLWIYRPSLRQLFMQRDGSVRSLDVPEENAAELFAGVRTWAPDVSGIGRRIVEASFGAAPQGDAPQAVSVPVVASAGPAGLLVLECQRSPGELQRAGIDALARQVAAVLVNCEALLRVRRHESQLEALYQTAGELSAKLELQTVLDAIVGRARTLIGTPTSYITLVDEPRGEIYMRAETGVSSPGFRRIRLRIGAGLGGAAAKSERPFYTSDYLNDARFAHTSSVDAEVRNEGIKSILGVPMRASTSVIGVLYVADRRVRVFTEGDVEILTSLAHHAALAIDNAALYERATAALAEIREVNEVVERQNKQLRRTDEVHRRLSEVVLAGDGLLAIVALIAKLVDAHVVVLDDRGRVRASAGEPSDEFGEALGERGLAPAMLADARVAEAARAVSRFRTATVPGDAPSRESHRLVVPVVARGDVLGSVWAEIAGDDADVRQVMEEASRVVALELLKEASIAEVERRLGRELLDELLSEHSAIDAPLERRAGELDLDLARPHRIAVTAIGATGDEAARDRRTRDDLALRMRAQPGVAFVGEHRGRVVALLDEEAGEHVEAQLARMLAQAGGKAVMSPSCGTARDYRASFLAADRVLALLGEELAGPIIQLESVGVIALLFGGAPNPDLQEFVERKLGSVILADERQGSDLLRTLEAYVDCGGSAARAATALHVHVNTMYYRLERLKALLGDALEDPRRCLDLHVALLARRLLAEPVLEISSNESATSS